MAQSQYSNQNEPQDSMGTEEEWLKKKNAELEKELRKSMEREERMKEELERTNQRLALLEEAEEMLCCQLGELKADAFHQCRLYQAQIISLTEQLNYAQMILRSSNTNVTTLN